MKKSIILLVTVLFIGIFAVDAAWHGPAAAYAAAQEAGGEAEQPKDKENQGGGGGHLGHH